MTIGNDLRLPSYIADPLARLRQYFPGAVCAGGSLRDLDNGKPVKDVDFFIHHFGQTQQDIVNRLSWIFPGWPVRVQVREEVCNYLKFENVMCVIAVDGPDGWPPLQVIVMQEQRSLEEILQRHDFGLCQIGTDGEIIIRSIPYLRDREDKIFTLVRCRDELDFQRSHGRFLKWANGKYQGWALRVPNVFTGLHLCTSGDSDDA